MRRKYNSIKKRFLRHGIDAFDFKNIGTNISLSDLLNKEIQFKIEGFSPLFFLLNLADHRDISIDFFIEEKKISFSELLKNFFILRNKNIPDLIRSKFEENFGNDRPKIRLNSFILTIYLLSFLFSHISRYKMHTWLKLIENDAYGIYNVGTEKKNLYELAKRTKPDVKMDAGDYSSNKYHRPYYTTMNIDKMTRFLNEIEG